MRGVPVLMYHALEDTARPSGAVDGEIGYVVDAEVFRRQLEFLSQAGYRTLLLEEVAGNKAEKAVVITFDDGHESNHTLALTLLKEYGFKAEFFITTDWVGTGHYLTISQLEALRQEGMGIGSHGASHRFLSDLTPAALERELIGSRDFLHAVTGAQPRAISTPGGRFDAGVAARAAAAEYHYFCTSVPGLFIGRAANGIITVPRVAVRRDTPLDRFAKMAAGDPVLYAAAWIRYLALNTVKKVLGNALYAKLHGALSRIINGS